VRWLVWIALAGCDWSLHRMTDQPKCTTYASTPFLPNGACALIPPADVVAWHADRPEPRPEVTRALLMRGRDRFAVFCAPCHGALADGESDVARVMMLRRPPTLIDDNARKLTDDRIMAVITDGYGLMPRYSLIAPADRWAITQYVRVLQQRQVALDQLPPPLQQEALRWLH
jgi:mono/diheme cytochrome c family protein